MKEERYTYDGPGKLTGRATQEASPYKAIFMTTEAVLPRLTGNPAVTRTEYEIISCRGGWEQHEGYVGLKGWDKRVAAECFGFDGGFALGPAFDEVRLAALREAIVAGIAPSTANGEVYIDTDKWDNPADRFTFAILWGIRKLEGSGHPVREITVITHGDEEFVEDLRARLLEHAPEVAATIALTHPFLGLLERRLPIPRDLANLDADLDARARLHDRELKTRAAIQRKREDERAQKGRPARRDRRGQDD